MKSGGDRNIIDDFSERLHSDVSGKKGFVENGWDIEKNRDPGIIQKIAKRLPMISLVVMAASIVGIGSTVYNNSIEANQLNISQLTESIRSIDIRQNVLSTARINSALGDFKSSLDSNGDNLRIDNEATNSVINQINNSTFAQMLLPGYISNRDAMTKLATQESSHYSRRFLSQEAHIDMFSSQLSKVMLETGLSPETTALYAVAHESGHELSDQKQFNKTATDWAEKTGSSEEQRKNLISIISESIADIVGIGVVMSSDNLDIIKNISDWRTNQSIHSGDFTHYTSSILSDALNDEAIEFIKDIPDTVSMKERMSILVEHFQPKVIELSKSITLNDFDAMVQLRTDYSNNQVNIENQLLSDRVTGHISKSTIEEAIKFPELRGYLLRHSDDFIKSGNEAIVSVFSVQELAIYGVQPETLIQAGISDQDLAGVFTQESILKAHSSIYYSSVSNSIENGVSL